MPNIVTNKIEIKKALSHQVKDIITFLTDADGELDFNKIAPQPEGLYLGDLGDDEIEQYGANNWEDWNYENWGTTKNAFNTDIVNNIIHFDTVWAGVPNLIKKVSEQFPNVEIDYEFIDEDDEYEQHIYVNGIEVN